VSATTVPAPAAGALKAPGVSAPLDVKNVLWLLVAMVFVVGPHLLRLPVWVTIFFLVTVAWRAWISWSALRSPPRWFMWAVTLATTYGTFLTYGRIFGREAGVTLLIIMAALKLLEMRTQRDVILAIYLGFFLVMTNFLFSQTIPLGLYMLACVWIFIATLVGFNRVGRSPTLRERLRPAGALLIQALPLMVAFFILFPRTQGPLWALPQDAKAGQTGLSETMSPGNIANLIKSDQLAFRVQFENGMPPYRSLYWRGPVLADFDGATWKMRPYASQGHMDYARQERPSKYVVTLEPHQKTWLFALDVPGSLPEGAQLLSDLQMRYRRPVVERMRYEVLSYLSYRFGDKANRVQLEQALALDETRNPKTVALGRQWARENPDPRMLLSRAAQFFGTGFAYTLEPPPLDRHDPFDDFVFNSKQGFCEHFAGAFTLLMRAAGVPARVVTGYQGGEVNPLNNELIVRQADAHAWSEIWVREEGWVRIDPTAAVAPMRVENGVNAALGPIGLQAALIDADKFGLLSNLRFAWQVMNSNWDAWVVGYNMDRQRQFFSGMGVPNVDWRTLGFWLMIAIFAAGTAVAIGLLVHDRPPPREPSLIAWNRFCSKMAAAGLAREPHEGPLDYLRRVSGKRPELARDIEEITRRYVDARYGAGASRDEVRALAKLVADFKPA
jgi:transglutaminase-like putative cysteine protease